MAKHTPEQIEEHRAFLAKITADYRVTIMKMVEPRALLAADHELQGMIFAAMDQGRYDAEFPPPTTEPADG